MGRFLTVDPIGYGDGLNVYAYVGNDPVNLVDPSGLGAELAVQGLGQAYDYSLGPQSAIGSVLIQPVSNAAHYLSTETILGDPGAMASIHPVAGIGGRISSPSLRALAAYGKRVASPAKSSSKSVASSRVTSSSPNFLVTPKGEAIRSPSGAQGPFATRAPGAQYTGGSGGNGLSPRVTGVRIMQGNNNQGPRVIYMNKSGQSVVPQSGKTAPKNDPNIHHYLEPWN